MATPLPGLPTIQIERIEDPEVRSAINQLLDFLSRVKDALESQG